MHLATPHLSRRRNMMVLIEAEGADEGIVEAEVGHGVAGCKVGEEKTQRRSRRVRRQLLERFEGLDVYIIAAFEIMYQWKSILH